MEGQQLIKENCRKIRLKRFFFFIFCLLRAVEASTFSLLPKAANSEQQSCLKREKKKKKRTKKEKQTWEQEIVILFESCIDAFRRCDFALLLILFGTRLVIMSNFAASSPNLGKRQKRNKHLFLFLTCLPRLLRILSTVPTAHISAVSCLRF